MELAEGKLFCSAVERGFPPISIFRESPFHVYFLASLLASGEEVEGDWFLGELHGLGLGGLDAGE